MNPLPPAGRCPLPGCRQPVENPVEPCDSCKAAFGDMLQPASTTTTIAEFTAAITQRDDAVRAVLAARRTFEPLPELGPGSQPAQPPKRRAAAAALTEQLTTGPRPADPQWRQNQTCWCCTERRTCRPDQVGTDPRWICKTCDSIR